MAIIPAGKFMSAHHDIKLSKGNAASEAFYVWRKLENAGSQNAD
jgi:hypothetical protein